MRGIWSGDFRQGGVGRNGEGWAAMTPPEVSVILPAWNRADSLRRSIDSVLTQDFVDFELIVVDDFSDDDSAAVAEAVGDARLRVIRHDSNRGAGAARNTGIAAARGRWVAFQDSDDVWLPGKLSRQLAALAAMPDAVACYCALRVEGTRPRQVPEPGQRPVEGDLHAALLRGSFISTQTLVVRRDALDSIGGFDPELPALIDWECVIRLASLGPFAFEPEPLVLQSFSENSITRFPERRLQAQEMILHRHRSALAERPEILALHHRRLAGAYRRRGERGSARRHLDEALRLQPLSPSLWALRLWMALG